jgi:Arc/MetJ family transcription regulator
MRINIDIDDNLLTEAMAAAGLATVDAVVIEALRRLVRRHQCGQAIQDMAGLGWEGDLDAARNNSRGTTLRLGEGAQRPSHPD